MRDVFAMRVRTAKTQNDVVHEPRAPDDVIRLRSRRVLRADRRRSVIPALIGARIRSPTAATVAAPVLAVVPLDGRLLRSPGGLRPGAGRAARRRLRRVLRSLSGRIGAADARSLVVAEP